MSEREHGSGPHLGYAGWPTLRGVYLEDSFVLNIAERPGELRFDLEAVFTPESSRYRPALPGEQHCYARGALTFTEVTDVRWLQRSDRPIVDADGEVDYGNIDSLTSEGDVYSIEGHWGSVRIRAGRRPTFAYSDREAST